MSDLDDVIARTTREHGIALRWFRDQAGRIVKWSDIQAYAETGARLVNQAKGIYKPHYMEYALSVRQTLQSPYADKELQRRADRSWVYPYFQENPNPAQRDREATNRGLMKCMDDGVPVGVLLQRTPKPGVQYEVLGLAKIVEWKDGYFILEGYSQEGDTHPNDSAFDRARAETDYTPDLSDLSLEDHRQKTMGEVIRRRGQARFRKKLIEVYQGKCAISGCNALEALEAAHILPYRGEHSDHSQNGLLLRADLHSLFDLGLISIEPKSMTVVVADSLVNTSYKEFAGSTLLLPADPKHKPSTAGLTKHLQWSGLSASLSPSR